MAQKDFRYDPLYRAIKTPKELRQIEGSYSKLFNRLDGINNLGIIPEVLRMAKYSKYEHHIGAVHQLNSLLDLVDEKVIPDKYRLPLKIAAIFSHVGHMPLTYSTERAVLVGSNLGDRNKKNKVRKYVEKRIRPTLNKANFDDDKIEKVLSEIFSLKNHNLLYRYFSAAELVSSWRSLKSKISELDDDGLIIALQNLFDPSSDGYKYLELADKADYTQRDALYFGTVKLDLSPEHLYRDLSKYHPVYATREARLIETSLDYLAESFYNDPGVICFTRIYEKIMAALMDSKLFKLEWLESYTDAELKRLICHRFNKDNKRVNLPESWTEKAKKLFDGEIRFEKKFELNSLIFDKSKDIIDIEYELVGKKESKTGLLNYPFQTGIVLSIKPENESAPFIAPFENQYSITVFQDISHQKLIEILKIVNRISRRLSISNVQRVREELGKDLSWTKEIRFDNELVNQAIVKAIIEIESEETYREGEFVKKAIDAFSSIKTYDRLWLNFENEWLWKPSILHHINRGFDEVSKENIYDLFVKGMLSLPIRLLQFKSTKTYLDEIYSQLMNKLRSNASSTEKGDAFEALWLIDLVRSQRGSFQFFFNGLVVVDPDKPSKERDEHEYDVIEFIINSKGTAECQIYACSIAENVIDKNREALSKLADHIHNVFNEITIRTYYVSPTDKNNDNWAPNRIDAGRNYNT